MLKRFVREKSIVTIVAVVCSILFCISLLLSGISIFVFYRNDYLAQLDFQAEMRLSTLRNELKSYKALDYWVKCWVSDPSKIVLPKNKKDKTEGKWHSVYGVLYDYISTSNIPRSKAEETWEWDGYKPITPHDVCYVQISDEFEKVHQYSQDITHSCFYPLSGGKAMMLFKGNIVDKNGNYSYPLGELEDFHLELHPNLTKCIQEKSDDVVRDFLIVKSNGMRLIQYYTPIYDKKGNVICVVSDMLLWSDYIHDLLKITARVELINACVHLLILAILLIGINIVVLRPVIRIKEAAINYADDKDIDEFLENLVPMYKYNNEIGYMAEDLGNMSVRIVNNLERIMHLTAEKEHLEGQLAMAVDLKRHLMPNVFPAFPDDDRFDIYADQIALERIGGDFYDFFSIDKDHIAIVIADIFAGGTVSALFMVAFKLILSQVASYDLPPSKTIEIVNNRLSKDNEDDLVMSAWFAIYECSTGTFCAVNAGHETPLIISNNGVREIEENYDEFIIGMVEGMDYREYSFTLNPGERLFLFTDGVLDSKNRSGESFGRERLTEALDRIRNDSDGGEEVEITKEVAAVQRAVFDFVDGESVKDDITLLCVERKE